MTNPVRILIIDDNEDDRLVYCRLLKNDSQIPYDIVEASGGGGGLKLLQEKPPACVLLDYSLPGHNGVEILKRIRGEHPFLPVIMLTGQGNEAVAVSAMQEGAQNYISKSTITAPALQNIVHNAIEHCSMQKRIHDQRASLEVFTRALAHDLKEPVRTISSFAELIGRDEHFSEKTQGHFQHIQKAAERMHMLIDTVYMYTRLEDPRQMASESCSMSETLNEVKENLARLIQERKATIIEHNLPNVSSNRAQLIQLLQNLISNAIRHSERAVTIRVEAKIEGDQALFAVSDNGPGIEAAYLQKIFEPFKRLSHQDQQGSGLGLAICKKIVESYGGKIWCESEAGKGATFLFTLPLAIAATESAPRTPVTGQTTGTVRPSVSPGSTRPLANVLLVDDSSADIEITQFRLIKRAGLQCNLSVARDGEEALAKLRAAQAESAIDLMLVDINMPEMDGFELLEKLKKDETLKNVAVVMCTGSIYDKDMQRARSLGAVGYLTKPVEFDQLKTVIDETPAFELCKDGELFALLRAA